MSNDFDAVKPEWWIAETLRKLRTQAPIVNFVSKDFQNVFAQAGEYATAHFPGTFEAVAKLRGGAIAMQDATTVAVPVKLNQHKVVPFKIEDRDKSSSFVNLSNLYAAPAADAIGNAFAASVMGEAYNLYYKGAKSAGKIGTAVDDACLRRLSRRARENKWPTGNRGLFCGAVTEETLLGITRLTEAQTAGSGAPIIQGRIGGGYGFDFYASGYGTEVVSPTAATLAGAVNRVGGYTAGSTTLVVDTFTAILVTGAWITIAGDMTPQRITAHTEGGSPSYTTGITITPGLSYDVANDAAITYYTPQAVDGTCVAGYEGDIVLDAAVPVVEGQGISVGGYAYMITKVTYANSEYTCSLNRPLDAEATNDAVVGVFPVGNYDLAILRDAIGIVSRPMVLPTAAGVSAAQGNVQGISIRYLEAYDPTYLAEISIIDTLFGVSSLDANKAILLFS